MKELETSLYIKRPTEEKRNEAVDNVLHLWYKLEALPWYYPKKKLKMQFSSALKTLHKVEFYRKAKEFQKGK